MDTVTQEYFKHKVAEYVFFGIYYPYPLDSKPVLQKIERVEGKAGSGERSQQAKMTFAITQDVQVQLFSTAEEMLGVINDLISVTNTLAYARPVA